MLPISFATSLLRRTLGEVTGAVRKAEVGPTVEEECLVRRLAHGSGQIPLDEATGLRFHPKMVNDIIQEELMFTRKVQVYLEVFELSGQVWVESHRNTMGLHEQV